jgi:hypothetical protein
MAILSPADTALAQWTYLYNTILAETAAGKRLSVLKDVRKSLDLWTKQQPAAGIQITDWQTQDYASGRRQLWVEFTIRVAVQSVGNGDANPPNGDDAMATLWNLISDGNGNGFSEVLRDPTNRTLGGNAAEFNLIGIKPFTVLDDGNTPDVWAEAYITCRSWKPLAIA